MRQVRIKTLWRTRRRESLFALTVLLLVIVSLGVNMKHVSRKMKHTLKGTAEPRKELLIKQEELQKVIDNERELSYPIQQLANAKLKFWITQSPNISHEFRKKVEQAAKNSNIRLKSIDSVKQVKITEGLNSYELTIATDWKINELLDLIAKIENEQPRIFWKNVRITPDNIRAPNFLIVNGTVQILVLSMPGISEQLWGKNE